jgi:hypothetical protein
MIHWNIVMTPAELGGKNNCAVEDQQQFTRPPSLCSRFTYEIGCFSAYRSLLIYLYSGGSEMLVKTRGSTKIFGRNSVRNRSLSIFLCRNSGLILCDWLTIWSWALLERPRDVRPLGSFPAFHGTRRFNTEFTTVLHLFLSLARPIQSTSPHPTSTRSILILSTHLRLGLLSGLFPSGFPTNNL